MDATIGFVNNSPSFDAYVSELFAVLRYLKISSSDGLPLMKKLFSTMITGILLSTLSIVFTLEIIGLKEIYNFETLTAHINSTCFQFLGLFKWIYCITHLGLLEELIQSFRECHILCQKICDTDIGYQKYHEKMTTTKNDSIKLLIVWFFFTNAAMTQWCGNAIVNDIFHNMNINDNSSSIRTMPLPIWSPFGMETWTRYILQFTFTYVGGIASSLGIAVFDVLCATLMMYICVQLEYLNESLVDENEIASIQRKMNPAEAYRKKLENCTLHHGQILRVLQQLENFSSSPMFAQCAENILALMLVSLEASTMKLDATFDSIIAFVSLIEYWMGIVFELFLYCFFASKIEYLGIQVSDSIFCSNWERLDIENNQKMINEVRNIVRFAMMRAQKPIIITGGPFYILNLPTFKALTGVSISNALVLRQLSQQN